ncbi:hypothetical protein QBC45DRAFT_167205 [Copromyces sp. CBS 386.78]|nr:hypothetical protein QBC45DRAFT_167205 [Copromyces sp. CBS 386.78]
MPVTRLTPIKALPGPAVAIDLPHSNLSCEVRRTRRYLPPSISVEVSSIPSFYHYNTSTSEQDHEPFPLSWTKSTGNPNPITPPSTRAPFLPSSIKSGSTGYPTTTQALISHLSCWPSWPLSVPAYTSRPRTYHQIHTGVTFTYRRHGTKKQSFNIPAYTPSQHPGRAPRQVVTSQGISRSTIPASPSLPIIPLPLTTARSTARLDLCQIVPDCVRLCQNFIDNSQPPPLHKQPFIAGSWILLSPWLPCFDPFGHTPAISSLSTDPQAPYPTISSPAGDIHTPYGAAQKSPTASTP